MGVPKQYKTVNVSPESHTAIKEYLETKGTGEDIGKFFELGALDRMNKEKKIKPKFKRNFFDTTKK